MTGRILICGNTCGHNHESLNGPTGCCAEHGPYMYFCGDCHDRWLGPRPAPSGEAAEPAPEAAADREGGACPQGWHDVSECGPQ